MASRLQCKVEYLPFDYLGLPLGGHPKWNTFWQPVTDKVLKKLDQWKQFQLSRGGRLTLCNSVLSSILLYYMSIFLMPPCVLVEFKRKIRNFFWGGHKGLKVTHLVR